MADRGSRDDDGGSGNVRMWLKVKHIGKSERLYWGEKYKEAYHVLTSVFPFYPHGLKRTYATLYADAETRKMFGEAIRDDTVLDTSGGLGNGNS